MIVSTSKQRLEEDKPIQHKVEPDLNKMAQRAQNFFKFKYFYDQMDFNLQQRLAMTKSIIELPYPEEIATSLRKGREEAPISRIAQSYSMTMRNATFRVPTTNPCTSL